MVELQNKEIELYKNTTDKIKMKKLYESLDITPNKVQEELIDLVDEKRDEVNNLVLCMGRRGSKSFSASIIIVRELLVPYSSVGILAPLIKVTGILWDEVRKRLRELNIKPTSINNQARTLELENGSTLKAASEDSIEALLGNRFSLIVVDEAAIFKGLKDILEMILYPTMSDFGVRKSGVPYGKMLIISTPRGVNNDFFYYFTQEKTKSNWKSLQYDSSVNPLNTKAFLEQMKESLDDLTYKQEILAQFVSIGGNDVFFSFNPDKNTYKMEEITKFITKDSKIVAGLDIGFKDSSASVLILVNEKGFYVLDTIMLSQSTTKEVCDSFKLLEDKYPSKPEIRYIDPAAALTSFDFANLYGYITYPADNSVREGISILNELFRSNKLFIEESLVDLIGQITTIQWKTSNSRSTDPFQKHKSHHFDLIHALRYGVYTYYKYNINSEIIVI